MKALPPPRQPRVPWPARLLTNSLENIKTASGWSRRRHHRYLLLMETLASSLSKEGEPGRERLIRV